MRREEKRNVRNKNRNIIEQKKRDIQAIEGKK